MNLYDTDVHHPDRAHGAHGLLALFNAHGVLSPADVHVATQIAALTGEEREAAVLAAALTVRAARAGSVCLDLAGLPSVATAADPGSPADEWDVPEEAWPDVDWRAHLASSPLVRAQPAAPLHLDGTRLYLTRYWREETYVLGEVLKRVSEAELTDDARASLAAYFPGAPYADQREAAAIAARSRLSILTGGPGTGKTTTIARLLGVLDDADPELRVAHAPPTGKAAARMSDALAETGARADFPPTPPARTAARLLAPTRLRARREPPRALRRRHHRRDVDGIADPDGPAARRGAPTGPARARRRRPPTRLRRRRGGARRPRRRAGRARREPGRRAHGDPALRFPHPRARRRYPAGRARGGPPAPRGGVRR